MVIARNLEGLKNHGQLFYPKNKDTLAIQNMNNTRQAVETVNFRLYFKVIIRQNQTQYFTYNICTEQESENKASPEARDYPKLLRYIYMMELLYIYNQTNK